MKPGRKVLTEDVNGGEDTEENGEDAGMRRKSAEETLGAAKEDHTRAKTAA